MWAYACTPPIRLHGVVLNYLSTRKTLPYWSRYRFCSVKEFGCFWTEDNSESNQRMNYIEDLLMDVNRKSRNKFLDIILLGRPCLGFKHQIRDEILIKCRRYSQKKKCYLKITSFWDVEPYSRAIIVSEESAAVIIRLGVIFQKASYLHIHRRKNFVSLKFIWQCHCWSSTPSSIRDTFVCLSFLTVGIPSDKIPSSQNLHARIWSRNCKQNMFCSSGFSQISYGTCLW
jgi:hypothetical protein